VALLEQEGLSQRKSCVILEVCRSKLFYHKKVNESRETLRQRIKTLALTHPRYGYRRIHALLVRDGLLCNLKTIYRLWKEEKLAVRPRKKKRKRSFGEALPNPPKALYPGHVWTYDFMQDQLANGKKIRLLNIVDEFTRECFAIEVRRSMSGEEVVKCLELAIERNQGHTPHFLRSDNGPEFIEKNLGAWLSGKGTRTLFIQPGSPWENGRCESFNGKFRDEFLDRENFHSLVQVQIQAEWWRHHYNHQRPHSALNYLTPAEFRVQYDASSLTQGLSAPSWGECSSLSPTRRTKSLLAH
jgi:putative transposase